MGSVTPESRPEKDRSDLTAMSDSLVGTTILVAGGGGFLGRTVLSELVRSYPGRVISVTRRPHDFVLCDPHIQVLADLRDFDKWIGLIREANFVLWMAALRDHGASVETATRENVDPLQAALAMLRGQPHFRRFLFASSISALDQPNRPHHPQPLTDRSPAYPRTPYGYTKRQSELLLATSGVPYTVLRLPFLYGPGFRAGSFLDFYRTAARTPALSAVRFTGNLSLLYTGDVAEVLLHLLDPANSSAADLGPYVLSDGLAYEVDELISLVAHLHGLRRPSRRTPALLGTAVSELVLATRRLTRPRPVPRGKTRLLLTYWSHAAFTRDYFVVNPARFHAAFPSCRHTPVHQGMASSFAVDRTGSSGSTHTRA
jgi:nucleoside-diphosphate-sugar epimerase